MDSNSEIQGYNVYPMLHFCRKSSSSVTPGSFQEMPLLFQCVDDSEYLLVMDLIVLFHWRQGFAIEGHCKGLLRGNPEHT